MATVWQKTINGCHYEVRRAGNSTRLYTDGVFHSQYNPDHFVTRNVWDLLMLPAFFYPVEKIRRVLVLGVGGGSVIHLLHRYVQPQEIIGIELNPVHLNIAKRFFGIDKKMAKLYQADAIKWLQEYQGPPFDMIIDDLFGEDEGEGVRAVALNARWFKLLNKNLSKNGLAVINLINPKSLNQSAYFTNQSIARHFPAAYSLTLPLFHNIIAVFLKKASSGSILRKRLSHMPGLNKPYGPDGLAFRIREIC